MRVFPFSSSPRSSHCRADFVLRTRVEQQGTGHATGALSEGDGRGDSVHETGRNTARGRHRLGRGRSDFFTPQHLSVRSGPTQSGRPLLSRLRPHRDRAWRVEGPGVPRHPGRSAWRCPTSSAGSRHAGRGKPQRAGGLQRAIGAAFPRRTAEGSADK